MAAKRRSTKKTTRGTTPPTKAKDSCFAIMPFGGWFDDYYTSIFVPAITEAGLTPCRADDLYRPSTIVADIWNYTNRAKLVIADLSGKNPNVFYELGLAHALAKPAILVVESMEDVPFDLRALRVLQYDKNAPNWGAILHGKIVKSIGEVLADPVQSVPTAYLETKRRRGAPPVTEHERELLRIRQDLDLLRREVRIGTRPHRELSFEGPAEAREELERMLRRGYPLEMIRRRLVGRGAPEEWVDQEVVNLSGRPLIAPREQDTSAPGESPRRVAVPAASGESVPREASTSRAAEGRAAPTAKPEAAKRKEQE